MADSKLSTGSIPTSEVSKGLSKGLVDVDKVTIGTGDIDTSENTLRNADIKDSDVKVTTNNMTSIEVKDGGTLKYKDAAAIQAEHEERRKDFNNFYDKAAGVVQSVRENSLPGKISKLGKNLEANLDKLCGVTNPSRFDSAVNMQTPSENTSGGELSK